MIPHPNRQRAGLFNRFLVRHGDPNTSPSETLIDLLTNAQHWCDWYGEDFHLCLAQACRHYLHELNDQQQLERRLP